MKIGDYEILPVETGRFALDGGAMFGVVPKNLWCRTNPADEKNRIDLALRSLLLKSDKRLILIDTGIGQKFDEKLCSIYKVDFSQYSLELSLNKYNVAPHDVTDVIITHLHFDHAGGTTYHENNHLKLTFPNAIHHVQSEHWDWALHPSDKDKASFFKSDFIILENENKVNKLSGPTELFSGLELSVMYGHTQGMQIVKIFDDHSKLLYCSDLIPTSSHIPIPWIMAYDNNPLSTMNEKHRILPRAVQEEWILFFEHDPNSAAGKVVFTDKGFRLGEAINLNPVE
jgi:glyoxylase-like metal-dependent hydrolase (beta-lactamase superfamily II)